MSKEVIHFVKCPIDQREATLATGFGEHKNPNDPIATLSFIGHKCSLTLPKGYCLLVDYPCAPKEWKKYID